MRRAFAPTVGVLVLLVLEACVFGARRSTHLQGAADPRASLVFGYFDPASVPRGLDFVDLLLLDPPSDRPLNQMRVHEGYFYGEWLTPGAYVLQSLGRLGRSELTTSRQASPIQIELAESELRWVGAFRVVDATRRTFELEPLDVPTETDGLVALLPLAEGTPWERRIRERLETAR